MFTLMCHDIHIGFKCCTHSNDIKSCGELSQEDSISLHSAVFSHIKKEVIVQELANLKGTWLSLLEITSSWSLHCCCRWVLDTCLQLFLVLSHLSSTLTSYILAQSIWKGLTKTHHEVSQRQHSRVPPLLLWTGFPPLNQLLWLVIEHFVLTGKSPSYPTTQCFSETIFPCRRSS